MQRAIEHRFFRLVYSAAPCSNIQSSIFVCIRCIATMFTSKVFSVSCANMLTNITGFRSISRRNNNQLNAIKRTFISKKLTKLVKTPAIQLGLLLFTFWFCSLTDIAQILNRNAFIFCFCFLYYLLTYCMVVDRNEAFFSPTKPFQQFFTAFRAFGLNTCSHFRIFFTNFFKRIGIIIRAIRKHRYICLPEVNTDKFFNVFYIFFWNFNGLKQIKLTFFIHQISLSFCIRQIVFIVANKLNILTTSNTPKRNNIIRFLSHNTAIVRNTAEWFENSFDFLIEFIRISDLTQATCNYLSRQIKFFSDGIIRFFMEFILVKNLFIKSYFRNKITSLIGFFDSVNQRIRLFFAGKKFYFQCQFHSTKIIHLFENSNFYSNYLSIKNEAQFLCCINTTVSLRKIA